MAIEITMPRLSDTMESGTLVKWYVKEGDVVKADQVLADVETDKATMEMPTYDAGTVAKILVPEGKSVAVGQKLMVLAAAGESVAEVAAKYGGRGGAESGGNGGASGSTASAGSGKGAMAGSVMPGGGGGAGTLAVPLKSSTTATGVSGVAEAEDGHEGVSVIEHDAGAARGGRLLISPLARRLAEERGIDLEMVRGTGPKGRIIKKDVMAAMGGGRGRAGVASDRQTEVRPSGAGTASTAAATVTTSLAAMTRGGVATSGGAGAAGGGGLGRVVALSSMRQTIAKRLVESKTSIPHYQVSITVAMEALSSLRTTLNEQLAPQGVKLSVNDFLVRGAALAIHRHPMFNASWNGDSIVIHDRVNVGVAVSLPEERGGGLVVAVVFDADRKGLRQISAETKALAEKARTKGLSVEEMTGSTFTISNLGMYGVEFFTAIINPPNSAILAAGAALEKAVVRSGQLVVGQEMSCTLSLDHRVIDGATGAEFLQTFKHLLENPATLLV